jgi:hypothetical protein
VYHRNPTRIATLKVSSIHITAWFGDFDRQTTTRICLKKLFEIVMDCANDSIVFVGDSPNSEPGFEFFNNSIGLPKVRDFAMNSFPSRVCSQTDAAGFPEVAGTLLEIRS